MYCLPVLLSLCHVIIIITLHHEEGLETVKPSTCWHTVKSVHVSNWEHSLSGGCWAWKATADLLMIPMLLLWKSILLDTAQTCGVRVCERTDGNYSSGIRQGLFLEEKKSFPEHLMLPGCPTWTAVLLPSVLQLQTDGALPTLPQTPTMKQIQGSVLWDDFFCQDWALVFSSKF